MSCVDVNTQFIGLSRIPVLFGGSVLIVWRHKHQSEIHCLSNNGQQDVNIQNKTKTNVFAINVPVMDRKPDAALIIQQVII